MSLLEKVVGLSPEEHYTVTTRAFVAYVMHKEGISQEQAIEIVTSLQAGFAIIFVTGEPLATELVQ